MTTNPYRFFFSLLARQFPKRALALAGCATAGIGLMGFEPVLIRELIQALSSGLPPGGTSPPTTDTTRVWQLFGLIAVIWLVSSLFNRLYDFVDMHTSPALRLAAQQSVYEWLDQHAPRVFQENFAGSLSQKIKQVGNACVSLLGIIFNHFVRLVMAIIVAGAVLSSTPAYFFFAFLTWLAIFVSLSAWLARGCVPLFKAFGEEVSRSTGILVDINNHMDVVRGNAKGLTERLRVIKALGDERDASKRTRKFLIKMMLILYSTLMAFQAGFIGMAIEAHLRGAIGLGEVVMVISLAAILVANVWGLSEQLLQFFEQVGTLGSALGMIAKPHEITDAPAAGPLVVARGAITFENIRYRLDNGAFLFDGFHLAVAGGEKLGLIGHSGAGKTTLLRLLRRHFELNGGRILIDGQDIAQVTLASLAKAIAVVPQDPSLFHRSLRENIVYAKPDASEDEIIRAIQFAHCEDFIGARKEGLDAVVGERGVKLSGGERQRIAIAQAFLKDAPILLLDEATSALDPETEEKIQDAIHKLCEHRTVIAIAHRTSTLARMDRIIDMTAARGARSMSLAATLGSAP